MCPLNPDWYYIRAAAIARQIYLRKGAGVGVGHLRRKFGENKHRGPKPNRFSKASGSIIRHIVKQFVEIGVFEKSTDGGRKISKEGMRDLDRIASRALAPKKKAKVNPNKPKKGTKSGSAKPKTKATVTKPSAKPAAKPAAKKPAAKKTDEKK